MLQPAGPSSRRLPLTPVLPARSRSRPRSRGRVLSRCAAGCDAAGHTGRRCVADPPHIPPHNPSRAAGASAAPDVAYRCLVFVSAGVGVVIVSEDFVDPAAELAAKAVGEAAASVAAQLTALNAVTGGGAARVADPVETVSAAVRFVVVRLRAGGLPADRVETLAVGAVARFVADTATQMRAQAESHPTVKPIAETLTASERDMVWQATLANVWATAAAAVDAAMAGTAVDPENVVGVAGVVVHLAAAAADTAAAERIPVGSPAGPVIRAAASCAAGVDVEQRWRVDASRLLLPAERRLLDRGPSRDPLTESGCRGVRIRVPWMCSISDRSRSRSRRRPRQRSVGGCRRWRRRPFLRSCVEMDFACAGTFAGTGRLSCSAHRRRPVGVRSDRSGSETRCGRPDRGTGHSHNNTNRTPSDGRPGRGVHVDAGLTCAADDPTVPRRLSAAECEHSSRDVGTARGRRRRTVPARKAAACSGRPAAAWRLRAARHTCSCGPPQHPQPCSASCENRPRRVGGVDRVAGRLPSEHRPQTPDRPSGPVERLRAGHGSKR